MEDQRCINRKLTYQGNKVTNHLEIGTMKNNFTVCSTVHYILS